MRNYTKTIFLVVVLLIALGGVFSAGIYLGYAGQPSILKIYSLQNTSTPDGIQVDFEPFWKAWRVVDEKFVPTGKVASSTENQARVWGAISGLASSLGDPYTVFFPPEEAKMFQDDINGNFQGVGMEIGIRDGILTVVAPLKNSPAENSGIKSGDKVIKIDDQLSAEFPVEKAVKLIRGKEGTVVKLTVVREGLAEPKEISITRAVINIPTIETEIRRETSIDSSGVANVTDGVFVIRVFSFSATAPDLFRQSLRQFLQSGTNKLIIDLRGNPGGFLEAAVDMASWFLPAGKVIVSEDFGDKSEPLVYRSRGYDIFNENLKLVILVDEGSASASEIFAGALSEQGKAKLIGAKTFGKGSVQELVKLTPDTSFKITIARWLTPNGNSISDGGLIPDILVSGTDPSPSDDKDVQLKRAIEYLNE